MGLLDFLRRLFGGQRPPAVKRSRRRPSRNVKLVPLRYQPAGPPPRDTGATEVATAPYRYAPRNPRTGGRLDLSSDGDVSQLNELRLPPFRTPEELAEWLQIPLRKLAWLTHRFNNRLLPESVEKAHYHYHWRKKRSGGFRLIESPKPLLKSVQQKILTEILNRIPPHGNAHGFVAGRSILTNARPHAGKRVVLKFDLENFYANLTYSRVVAIFRRAGYSREAAIWLGRLTTSALPGNIPFPDGKPDSVRPYQSRHLPQGAPTSPALANLSAFSLDVRLSGLARCYAAAYTRYADDLTFSGSGDLLRALPVFIPLVTKIIRSERFRVNRRKRKVLRNNQRQSVTGVVVNEKPNLSRREFDRLKAILTNALRHGPASQNRENHPDFPAHLRGRIAHLAHLNPPRGARLLELYYRIDWQR